MLCCKVVCKEVPDYEVNPLLVEISIHNLRILGQSPSKVTLDLIITPAIALKTTIVHVESHTRCGYTMRSLATSCYGQGPDWRKWP